jgi:DNA-binding NarL/FixJ family response regulator
VTFFAVDGTGDIPISVALGRRLAPPQLREEVRSWKRALRGIDPLAPARLAQLAGPIATLDDVGGMRRAVHDRGSVRRTYEDLGVINDVRMLIRDGERLVAGVTLWRRLQEGAWTDDKLRLLAVLQPLIEEAYVSSLHAASNLDARLPDTLTPRQRQVARMLATGATTPEIARDLYISHDTVKSHARAVLRKTGVKTRRELVQRLAEQAKEPEPSSTGEPQRRRRQPSVRPLQLVGTPEAQHLLAPVLDWAAESIEAVIGGCALLSVRGETAGEAWASARAELDSPIAWRVHRAVLPQPGVAIVGPRGGDSGWAPVFQLDRTGEFPTGEGLEDLLASVEVTAPLLAVLRRRGRVAAVIWLCRDAGTSLDAREAVRRLRGVHQLLELVRLEGRERRGRRVVEEELVARGLSERELAVARLTLAGHSNAVIARRLGISPSTVKKHVLKVLAKCGVRSRTQLIALLGGRSDPE